MFSWEDHQYSGFCTGTLQNLPPIWAKQQNKTKKWGEINQEGPSSFTRSEEFSTTGGAVGYNRLVNKELRKVEATDYLSWRCPEPGKTRAD